MSEDVIADVNVSLSRWPCRRLPLDDTGLLVAELKRHGVTRALAGTFDAMLHNDIAGANQRLAEECQRLGDGLLLPIGAANLSLPGWENDVRRCCEFHGMRGLRLLPGYHDYDLADSRFTRLLSLAADEKLLIQIAVRLEDPRTQHRLLSVKDVDLNPLLPVLDDYNGVPIMLLNALSSVNSDLHSQLAAKGRVYFDISTLEGLAGLERQLQSLPAERLMFGSHAPFFVFESAQLKLHESEIPSPVRDQIAHTNLELLLQQLDGSL